MDVVKETKRIGTYKPKVYRTKQLEFADEVRILDDELFLSVPANKLLNRWMLNNKVTPTIELPIRYSSERKRYELLKEPIFTKAGALKAAIVGAGLEKYDRNPTSNVDGYITISGTEEKTEEFLEVMSVIDIFTKDNDIYYQLSADGVEFGKKVMLRGSLNQTISIDFSVKAVKLTNVITDGSANGAYQVVAYK